MKISVARFCRRGALVLLLWLFGGLSSAFAVQSGLISDTNKHAWSENSGWLNFKPADGGVTVYDTYLAGYVWAANVGWIKLGSTATNGTYGNTTSSNWGVNRNATTGVLSGYAWSENVGWISFNHDQGHVTISPSTGDFSGYAWSANIGYIHFANTAPVSYKVQVNVAAMPASLTVPASDADGAYAVSWAAVSGASSYVLEEATKSDFSTGKRTIAGIAGITYNVTGRATGTTYYYRVKAVKVNAMDSGWRTAINGCVVPVASPASITVPVSDDDGVYAVTWAAVSGASSYVLEEATKSDFSTGKRTIAGIAGITYNVTGRATGTTYYYRVKAVKISAMDSGWRTAINGCVVPVAPPASMTVPVSDADGKFTISWTASPTAGVTYYVLEQSTTYTFTPTTTTVIKNNILATTKSYAFTTARPTAKTYYYRVKAKKTGLADSVYRNGANGCAVPGTALVVAPGAVTFTLPILHGYTVNWVKSTTVGVTYVLEEATNSLFTVGLRTVYSGAGLSAKVTGRTTNTTYYYRVRAVKAGAKDSAWKTGTRKAT